MTGGITPPLGPPIASNTKRLIERYVYPVDSSKQRTRLRKKIDLEKCKLCTLLSDYNANCGITEQGAVCLEEILSGNFPWDTERIANYQTDVNLFVVLSGAFHCLPYTSRDVMKP